MALFSFRHSVKTFSEKRRDETRAAKQGQTAAHLRYITRPQAARVVMQERLSGSTQSETARLAEVDAQKRKGRVCERFVIALPVEASPRQREAMTRAYAEEISKGIAGYVVAIHDKHGNDTKNPHAHFVFFDVQQKTGGRGRPKSTLGLARKNSIETAARSWSELHNEMMRKWGFGAESNISHLSFADRGIDKIPTIHEGASSRATLGAKKSSHEKWKHIDQGHTRDEANAVIREINHLKEKQENAGTIRLGTCDRNNPPQRNGGISKQRECCGRHVKTIKGNRPPFTEAVKSIQDHRAIDRNTESHPLPHAPHSPPRRPPPFMSAARFGLARSLRYRRGVRRVYHELIMLRDTLKAQFLADEQKHRLSSDPPEKNIEMQMTKPRRSGAEIGDRE
jgi:hypothetical protein